MMARPTYEELEKRLRELEEQVVGYRREIELLKADHTRLQAILESAIHAIVVVNDRGQVIEWPSQAELLCGWSKSEMLGKSISLIMPHRIREQHQGLIPEVLQGQHGAIFGKRIETTILNRNEFEVPVEIAVTMTKVGERAEITLFMHDITERKNYETQLHHMSITDELTGLFNRRGFITLADKQLKLAQRSSKDAFLLYADFDNMKWINDTHGHPVGDSALVETAAILNTTFRQADLIGRVGGDEFIVLMNEPKERQGEEVVLERLASEISKANSQPDRKYQILLSIGTVRYDHSEQTSIDELMSRADLLMYENKKRKKTLGLDNYSQKTRPLSKRKSPQK